MAVNTAQLGNLSITTQVLPASESKTPGIATLPSTQKKKQPMKSLSAVIILIGVLQLSVGVSMYVAESNYLSLVSRSGIVFMGSLAFIFSGIVTVVFANEESIDKIKICLISHVINATIAFIGIILYAVQVYTDTQSCWVAVQSVGNDNQCVPGNSSTNRDEYHYPYRYYELYAEFVYTLRVSLNSLVLFYIMVGLVISVCIILLRWKSLKKARYTLL